MATYQAISVTSQAIVGLLYDACPRADFPTAQFQLFESNDFNSPPIEEGVSVYLYRVATNMTRRNLPPRLGPDGKRYRPSLPVDLFYMLTAWAKAPAQQQRLLGWAMRTLEDTPIIPAGYLNQYSGQETFHSNETVELVPGPLSTQDNYNIWNGFKPNMHPSVAYIARLIQIESSVVLEEGGLVQTRELDLAKVTGP